MTEFDSGALPESVFVDVNDPETFIPAEGRSVVVQIAPGEWRPAQIVKVWTETGQKTCNLVVFIDGSNDARYPLVNTEAAAGKLSVWMTSCTIGHDVRQYLPRKP